MERARLNAQIGRTTSREEVAAKMTRAEQLRKPAELMTREEPLLPELRPLIVPNMHIDPDQVIFANARYLEAEDALEDEVWSGIADAFALLGEFGCLQATRQPPGSSACN